MSRPNALEIQALQMLLAGDDKLLSILRAQADVATVLSRQMTGVGFFTQFLIPDATDRAEGGASFTIGDVNGTASNLRHGLGLLVYVNWRCPFRCWN
jgi:hypothetical protein